MTVVTDRHSKDDSDEHGLHRIACLYSSVESGRVVNPLVSTQCIEVNL